MLKNIPTIISPILMKTLMEMGHGDELVLADGNFPAASNAQQLIRYDGHDIPELLKAILFFFPLDECVDYPVSLMQVGPGKEDPSIWEDYKIILEKYEPKNNGIEYIERFDFYERAKKAYAIIATSEKALCANIILKKGVVYL